MRRKLERIVTLAALVAVANGVTACGDKQPIGVTQTDAHADSGNPSVLDASKSTSNGETTQQTIHPQGDAADTLSVTVDTTSNNPPDAVDHDASVTSDTRDAAHRGHVDLEIESASIDAVGFTTVEVPEASCEIQDGCYGGSGLRTVIPFELTIKNAGTAPLELGLPWENDNFYLSSCASQYRTTNFVQAEVLADSGEVLAVRHLPTSCIASSDSSTYNCHIQGLDVGESSKQPSLACNGLDVTGLTPGAYTVRFTINADGRFAESDTSNNSVEVALNQPECEARFCGGVCCPESAKCVDNVCLLPDLRANQDAVERSLIIKKETFGENSCEIAEMCVTGPGKRRLLQFEGRIENAGTGDLNPGREQGNPLFEHSECHDHYHFLDFTDYKLLNQDGSTASQGHKQSFCLVNMDPVEDYDGPNYGYPPVRPEPGDEGCSYLSAGWADIYGVGTPCQWVDITDVKPGEYILQVAVNPNGKIAESNVDNNVIQVPVSIPADSTCQAEEVCGDVVDQDCDGYPDPGDDDCIEELCCGQEDDVCHLGGNYNCDCNGEPEWEHHDCEYQGSDYPVPECCNEEDSCGWAHDGECDCNGVFEWDQLDCTFEDWCCADYDYCGYSDNGICNCGGDYEWDAVDCAKEDAGSTSPVLDDGGPTSPQSEAGLMSEAGSEATMSTPDANAVDAANTPDASNPADGAADSAADSAADAL